MKTNPDDPISYNMVDADGNLHGGLTKREHFAAMAMQGLLSHNGPWFPDHQGTKNLLATAACKYADALIAELNKAGEL